MMAPPSSLSRVRAGSAFHLLQRGAIAEFPFATFLSRNNSRGRTNVLLSESSGPGRVSWCYYCNTRCESSSHDPRNRSKQARRCGGDAPLCPVYGCLFVPNVERLDSIFSILRNHAGDVTYLLLVLACPYLGICHPSQYIYMSCSCSLSYSAPFVIPS
ncbi:hypothetical protein BKA93DRAFT_518921 [Sparassis latifolia]